MIGGLKPSIKSYQLIPTNITLSLNEQVKIDAFDQFVVTCFNTTAAQKNATKEDLVLYERAFAGFAKQEVKLKTFVFIKILLIEQTNLFLLFLETKAQSTKSH